LPSYSIISEKFPTYYFMKKFYWTLNYYLFFKLRKLKC
jgi:hypothetical protein